MKLCGFEVGLDQPLFLIAGPCVVESRQLAIDTAGELKEIDRGARHSVHLQVVVRQGQPQLEQVVPRPRHGQGLEILADVKKQIGVPVLTDVHASEEIAAVAAVVDVLQTPAFLCRQTDFIRAVAIERQAGQHQEGPVPRARRHEERGRQGARSQRAGQHHGVRARRIVRLQQSGLRHALAGDHARNRLPGGVRRHAFGAVAGGQGTSSGGQREFVPVLARAAVATGVAGVFMETHPNPEKALSDGPNAWPLHLMKQLLETLKALDELVKTRGFAESALLAKRGR